MGSGRPPAEGADLSFSRFSQDFGAAGGQGRFHLGELILLYVPLSLSCKWVLVVSGDEYRLLLFLISCLAKRSLIGVSFFGNSE